METFRDSWNFGAGIFNYGDDDKFDILDNDYV